MDTSYRGFEAQFPPRIMSRMPNQFYPSQSYVYESDCLQPEVNQLRGFLRPTYVPRGTSWNATNELASPQIREVVSWPPNLPRTTNESSGALREDPFRFSLANFVIATIGDDGHPYAEARRPQNYRSSFEQPSSLFGVGGLTSTKPNGPKKFIFDPFGCDDKMDTTEETDDWDTVSEPWTGDDEFFCVPPRDKPRSSPVREETGNSPDENIPAAGGVSMEVKGPATILNVIPEPSQRKNRAPFAVLHEYTRAPSRTSSGDSLGPMTPQGRLRARAPPPLNMRAVEYVRCPELDGVIAVNGEDEEDADYDVKDAAQEESYDMPDDEVHQYNDFEPESPGARHRRKLIDLLIHGPKAISA